MSRLLWFAVGAVAGAGALAFYLWYRRRRYVKLVKEMLERGMVP